MDWRPLALRNTTIKAGLADRRVFVGGNRALDDGGLPVAPTF